tara:strand:- start:113 stop:496 length:384 start_codon:yes stop_codon:yes gene_type:complete
LVNKICFSVKASILASQDFTCSRVHIFFFTGRVNGSRVHNYFSASIRTAGALLSSTDFIGITDIVNDIFRGERTEPLYKDKKKIIKKAEAQNFINKRFSGQFLLHRLRFLYGDGIFQLGFGFAKLRH